MHSSFRLGASSASPFIARLLPCPPQVYVGSNVDTESSVWELQDKRVVIFHLVKWHRLAAGNVRDTSRTWWRKCFQHEETFEHENPPGVYYEQKDK